jgi:hypothetical protein
MNETQGMAQPYDTLLNNVTTVPNSIKSRGFGPDQGMTRAILDHHGPPPLGLGKGLEKGLSTSVLMFASYPCIINQASK